jgi:hypothetical protein
MSNLIELAAAVMEEHGWETRREHDLAEGNLKFDLVAENETAIAFFETVGSSALARKVDALSASVAAVTLRHDAGIKAWEAYLLLLVTDGSGAATSEAEAIQRDLSYCRKIVIDGESVGAAIDQRAAMESILSFLFPFDFALVPQVEDVREHMIELISNQGQDEELVRALVNAFDTETDCQCWRRAKEFASRTPE